MLLSEALNLNDSPKYSVFCLTYNHMKFIRKSLDSVLGQEIDGAAEIIVLDDCSTDGTSDYLSEVSKKYSNFKHIRTEKNLFGTAQHTAFFEKTFNETPRGKYIFYLELDDVWTDPRKMTLQAACLDLNDNVSFCFHEYIQVDECETQTSFKFPESARRDYKKEELLSFDYSYILLSTCAFRRVNEPWPVELYAASNGDMFWPAHFGQFGSAKFLPQIAPHIYRIHGEGNWSSASPAERMRRKLGTSLLMMHNAVRRKNWHAFVFTLRGRFASNLKAIFGPKY